VFAGNGNMNGGWRDFRDAFDDRDSAIESAQRVMAYPNEWAEVVDLETLKEVWLSSGADGEPA
jgi:hypothetical protein